jgi:hypothetical protein
MRRVLKVEGRRRFEDMTVEDAVYLACLVDCEGCIGIYGRYTMAQIDIHMTAGFPRALCEEWGGGIYSEDDKNPRHKIYEHWKIMEQDRVRVFLLKIKPYLRLKRRQADLALRIIDVCSEKGEGWKGERDHIREETHKLNKTGR